MSFLTRHTQALGMSTAKWMELPVQLVDVAILTPTQGAEVDLWPERRPNEVACRDPYIHVVQLGRVLYVEDGAHRVARARRDHEWRIEARILQLLV